MPPWIARSYLFVPGNRPDRFAKALSAGADAVIIDLEDAVPPGQKSDARKAAADWLATKQPAVLRINAAASEWFLDDLELCALPGVAGVILPKAEGVEDLVLVRSKLTSSVPLLPLIETARGFRNAGDLAQAPSVQRLIFGPLDFQLDMGMKAEDDELLYFRSQLVLISRLAGLQAPVDGINTAIEDLETLRADTLRSRRLGFGGKLLIHPRQIAVVHECFGPSAEEIAWAKRVLQAASASQGAAVAMSGELVDRPIIARAEAILRESDAHSPGKASR